MTTPQSKYAQTGVDVRKAGTEVFRGTVEGLFPHAFTNVVQDPTSRYHGRVLHSDGQGSKFLANYVHWKETGDVGVVERAADDTVEMNIGDYFCVKGRGKPDILFADYVALNPFTVPKREFLGH